MKVVINMFSLRIAQGLLILVIFFIEIILSLNFKLEILLPDSIFYMTVPIILKKRTRGYLSKEEKIRVSNSIPDWFKQIVCGIMLSDGSIRMNGKEALLSIQQTQPEITQGK
jgi:hypothetical protein